MNARKGNITVEPYTRSVRTVQREGRKSLNFPSTLFGIQYHGQPAAAHDTRCRSETDRRVHPRLKANPAMVQRFATSWSISTISITSPSQSACTDQVGTGSSNQDETGTSAY